MNKLFFFIAISTIAIIGCEDEPEIVNSEVLGMKPIYEMSSNLSIERSDIQEYENLGKIVYQQPFIYINEKFKGIHVVDNSDPTFPEKVDFYRIPGNTDFTIKGDFIYANNLLDLVTIEISSDELVVKDRKVDFYSDSDNAENLFPGNDYFGPFECVDSSKGIVIGWEDAILLNPKCRR